MKQLSYNNPDHPEHKEWLVGRRKRFIKILREGQRVLKLSPDERAVCKQLADLIAKNNEELLKLKNLTE